MLENVTVRSARKKTPIELLDEKYATGVFSTEARKIFDLVNNDDWKNYNNVFDYLRAHGYSPGTRTPFNSSSSGNFPTAIYVDDYLVSGNATNRDFVSDDDVLETIPMSRIAMIKVYSSFIGAEGNSPGGAIAIFTKKGEDSWNSIETKPSNVIYNGYSLTKEFYVPDYSVRREKKNMDNRITLDWRPDILVNYVNPKIPVSFYNNDRTKKFHVVVEGMTVEGKMIMIDQVIERH